MEGEEKGSRMLVVAGKIYEEENGPKTADKRLTQQAEEMKEVTDGCVHSLSKGI